MPFLLPFISIHLQINFVNKTISRNFFIQINVMSLKHKSVGSFPWGEEK